MYTLIEKRALLNATPYIFPVTVLLRKDEYYTNVCYSRPLSKPPLDTFD